MNLSPTRAIRHDGWTLARQTAFVAALAAGGSVEAAAVGVGLSRQSAYRLRARGDAAVLAAWGALPVDAEAQADRLYAAIDAAGAALSARIDAAANADPRGHDRWLMRELVAAKRRRFASTSVTFDHGDATGDGPGDDAAMLALDRSRPPAPPCTAAEMARHPQTGSSPAGDS